MGRSLPKTARRVRSELIILRKCVDCGSHKYVLKREYDLGRLRRCGWCRSRRAACARWKVPFVSTKETAAWVRLSLVG